MEKRGLSQEGLKLIACLTMLLDHIGATLVPWIWLRVVGRIAFPIYCYLLTEGVCYTKNEKRYGIRLLIGAVLAEIPFDLLFYGRLTLQHQSVMITLLLGLVYLSICRRIRKDSHKILLMLPFVIIAELLGTDYGGWGVAMVALFLLTRNSKNRKLIQVIGMAVLCWMIGGYSFNFGIVEIPLQLFGVAAMVPIFCYTGRKATGNVWVQWMFYLFYPVHLLILLLITVFF